MNVPPTSSTFDFLHQPLNPPGTVLTRELPSSLEQSSDPSTLAHALDQEHRARKKPIPQIPGYEMLKELGRGGMGVVYLARQSKLGRLVALKMMLAGVLSNDEDLARFQAEAEIISQLQHPNIVQVHEIGDHEGYAYFSMEYVPGGTLARRIYRRTLPPKEAAEIVRTLALAVQAAHDKGIIHRDLKPGNVLLLRPNAPETEGADEETDSTVFSPRDIPKLTDFGMAKRLQVEGLTQSGVVLGTPEYMAPEQAMGLSSVLGPAVDIYALGAILYELLTGKPPFKGASPLDTIQQVVLDDLVPPTRLQPKLPRDLETICVKCLRKEAVHRYASARALAEDLERFLDGQAIQARPVGPVERLIKWARRKPAQAGLVATVILAMVLLSFAVMLLLQANTEESRQRRLAEENARRARNNAQLARQALDSLSITMTEEAPFNEEPMRAARMKLLDKALRFYEKFEADLGEDQQVLQDAATHRFRLAVLTEEIGSKEKAQQHYAEAVRLWEKLVLAHPSQRRYQQDRARSLTHLGLVQLQLGHDKDAEASFRQAQDSYQQLLLSHPTDALGQAGLAEARSHLGLLFRSRGQLENAEDNYKAALRLLEQLAAAYPLEVSYRAKMAATLNRLGLLYEAPNKRLQAIAHYEEALQAYQEVIAARPNVSTYQAELASVYNNLCTAYLRRHGWDLAEKYACLELPILERLTTTYPEVTDYQARLVAALNRRGTLQRELAQFAAAAASLQRALDLGQGLADAHAQVLDYQMQLANIWYNLGVLANDQKQTEEALTHYAQSEQVVNAMLAKHPRDVRVREQRKMLHRVKAFALEEASRPAEALKEWDQALALADRRPVEYLHHRGVCQARSGDFTAAAATAAEVTVHQVQNGVVLIELARIHALCLAGITDKATRESHATAAMQALQRALERNFLRHAEHQKALREDADFAVLRARDDFQELLKSLPPPEAKPPRTASP